MATGQLQGLRHQIRDIVGDGSTYNGLAGRAGLSFEQQRQEFRTITPRVAEKVQRLRAEAEEAAARLNARADELEGKQAQVEEIVVNALGIIDAREADPNFAASNSADPEDADFPEEEDEEDDFEDDDFEEYEEEEDEEPSFTEKVKGKVSNVL